jgi:hypothetical protein
LLIKGGLHRTSSQGDPMKQILPELKELNKHLTFAKKAFTKRGFRHFSAYIDGLITLNKKTVKQISKASLEENHHSAISRILTSSSFEQELLEKRYLKKLAHFMKGMKVSLIFDDTLVEHNGKSIEETQSHKDHAQDSFIAGHQFFTAILHTELMQLPLFPRLYSKNTDSKIEMAKDTIDTLCMFVKLHSVVFDSWYSDKKIIKKCMTRNITVVCSIKTNRVISKKEGEWKPLASFSKKVKLSEMEVTVVDDSTFKIKEVRAKLSGIPFVKLIISREWDQKRKWGKRFHLISTNTQDTPAQIIRHYAIRWCIETYHRDIKQNLGFAGGFFRKKEGIVRHAIFSTLAYAILKLFMFSRGMTMTIGECIAYIQNKGMDDLVLEIVEIEDKAERMELFKEVFISKSAKV